MYKHLNISDTYFFIWVLYIFHWQKVGGAFPLLEAMSNVLLGINLLISMYYAYLFWTRYEQTTLFKSMNVLFFSLVIYGSISALTRDYVGSLQIKSGTYLIGAMRTFLPIYTCVMFTKLGYLTEKKIRFWFYVFFLQSIYIYFTARYLTLGLEMDDFDELRTNNTAYLFVSLFPLIYFFRKERYIQYVFIAILLFLTITGLKRGAILSIALATIYYFYCQFKTGSGITKKMIIVTLLIFATIGSSIVVDIYEDSRVFQHRMEMTMEGNVSRRDVIAQYLLNIYASSNLWHTLFGFGADGTVEHLMYAHNDWLEMLFDQGIWGIVIYAFFWYNIFKFWRNKEKMNHKLALLMGLWFICNFPKSLFSMWYSMTKIMSILPLGYALAKAELNSYEEEDDEES